jgi:hypothetical protein
MLCACVGVGVGVIVCIGGETGQVGGWVGAPHERDGERVEIRERSRFKYCGYEHQRKSIVHVRQCGWQRCSGGGGGGGGGLFDRFPDLFGERNNVTQ